MGTYGAGNISGALALRPALAELLKNFRVFRLCRVRVLRAIRTA
jgi:hypothetical protein